MLPYFRSIIRLLIRPRSCFELLRVGPSILWRSIVSRSDNICVQRHAGIGDILCTLPAVAMLREQATHPFVIYETARRFLPVVKLCPDVDVTLELNSPAARFTRKLLNPRLIKPLLPDELTPPRQRPAVHLSVEFAQAFGLERLNSTRANLRFKRGSTATVRKILSRPDNTCGVAVVHAGPTWKVKEWSIQHWNTLVSQLRSRLRLMVVQIGDERDASGTRRDVARIDGAVDLIGRLSISEILSLLDRSDVFVGVDSGMIHLAHSVGVPVVGLAGPTSTQCFLPARGSAAGVTSDVPCLGCHHAATGPIHWQSGCPYGIRCMHELDSDRVVLAVEKVLAYRS
jgi:ADP-heptose:LPS heptosyltransferase